MKDIVIAGVRTAVQVGVASAVAWAAKLGLDIDSVALEAVAFSVTVGAVTMALNWLTVKVPFLGSLLSLGLSKNTPAY
jgi:hypothetical protein